jgi:choline-sulfatase
MRRRGLADDTLVIFCSDHGEMLGSHGMWWKCAPFEPSIRTPLIMAGPDLQSGLRVTAPVENADLFPTVVDAAGCELADADATLTGESLMPVARGQAGRKRDHAFVQYHGHGVSSGWFALRRGDYKYIHYHGHGAELYNLADDPGELHDLCGRPDQQHRVGEFDALLRSMVDPAQVDAQARADQGARLEWIGRNMPGDDFERKLAGE